MMNMSARLSMGMTVSSQQRGNIVLSTPMRLVIRMDVGSLGGRIWKF
jgi:hypothetical protein